jgi:16S rRNA (guanine527-N7)-methyltransferase
MFHVEHHNRTTANNIVSRETSNSQDSMKPLDHPFPDHLAAWASQNITADQINKLDAYRDLLLFHSHQMSLISKADLPNIWGRHICDSLTPAAFMDFSKKGRWVDLGCGAGLPLIPIAILLPHWDIVGLDTRILRIELLQEFVKTLGLTNCHPIKGNGRVQGMEDEHCMRYDIASTRAVGKIKEDAAMAAPFLKPGGTFLTFKGSERIERIDGYRAPTYTPYRLPGVDNDLHLVRTVKL